MNTDSISALDLLIESRPIALYTEAEWEQLIDRVFEEEHERNDEWTATVVEWGGGMVRVLVDRNTVAYPETGARVRVSIIEPRLRPVPR